MAEKLIARLWVTGWILAWKKYLYGLKIVVPDLDVGACGFYVCRRTHDTKFILREGQRFLNKKLSDKCTNNLVPLRINCPVDNH